MLLAFLGSVACGGGDASTATVEGTVGGVSLAAQDAIIAALPAEDGKYRDTVVIGDFAHVCSQSRDNAQVPNGTRLALTLIERDSTGALEPLTPGDFPISEEGSGPRVARAMFQKLDGSCTATFDAAAGQAVSGTVTVTTATFDFTDGTFDLEFPGGDRLTGTFHAAVCAEPTRMPPETCRAE